MKLGNPFKLEKLTITAVDSQNPVNAGAQSFTVMFNPESFAEHFGNKLQTSTGVGAATNNVETRPAGSEPEKLELHLIIDGTGAADFAVPTGLGTQTKSVHDQISDFRELCYNINGEQHAPNVVHIQWGIINSDYRLEAADITYKSFDRTGQPLRAELDVSFIKHNPSEEDGTSDVPTPEELKSPDLTHARIVKAGDTLPLLTREIYGSSTHYLLVAAANNLDNFRRLEPGQQLVFPPLEK